MGEILECSVWGHKAIPQMVDWSLKYSAVDIESFKRISQRM